VITDTARVSISRAFEPIMGLPCWGVTRFHGSMLMIEFGEPRLSVEEPRSVPLRLEVGPEHGLARRVSAVGQWTLEILSCDWELRLGPDVIAHHETQDPFMARALRHFEGQALNDASVDEIAACTTFAFDLGATLTTRPAQQMRAKDAGEHWTLRSPDGSWTAFGGDASA
jgi:hypothetical protein